MKRINQALLIVSAIALLTSCVSVEAYQKAYLNDEYMELNAHKICVYEINFQAYREGASGANGGKTGGGCGCN